MTYDYVKIYLIISNNWACFHLALDFDRKWNMTLDLKYVLQKTSGECFELLGL